MTEYIYIDVLLMIFLSIGISVLGGFLGAKIYKKSQPKM